MVPNAGDRSNETNVGVSSTVQTDGGTTTEIGEMAVYTAVRGAVKDALLEVIGLLLQLSIGLALVFLGVRTLLRSGSVIRPVIGAVLLGIGILVAVPVLRLVQPLRV